jgi:hypothetical protein
MTRARSVRRRTNHDGQRRFQIGIGLALVALGLLAVTQQRRTTARRRLRPMRDYSDRSGFPLGVEASRGIASDAPIPADMLTPEALRPFAVTGHSPAATPLAREPYMDEKNLNSTV